MLIGKFDEIAGISLHLEIVRWRIKRLDPTPTLNMQVEDHALMVHLLFVHTPPVLYNEHTTTKNIC